MARLFFALWPDATAAARLAVLAGDVGLVTGGKPMPLEKIHLTLAFLGEVPEARLAEARAAAAGREPVAIRLDCVGSFRRARVAWAGSLEPNEPLAALQSALAGRLRERGFALEDRPFAPHLTLARKTVRPLPRAAIPAIEWTARELVLASSDLGSGRYSALAAWPLGGKALS